MKRKATPLFINSISAILQTLIYTVLIAILYRCIIDILGVNMLGVWSVILSTTSLAGLTNSGITSSITKFVSQYYAVEDIKNIQRTLDTSIILIGSITLIFTISGYLIFYYSLPFFLKLPDLLTEARIILPYSFLSLFINSVAGIYLSCFDGLHKIYLRSGIIVFSSIVYFILSIVLIHFSGLLGLAYAQVIQSVVTLLISTLLLKKILPAISLTRIKWHKETFKEIFRYSTRLQFATILQILMDPIMKLLLSRFGSIAITAYYDMAVKVVNGFRTVIIAAAQAIVPEIAKLKSLGHTDNMLGTLRKSQNLVLLFSTIAYPALIGFSPAISKIWLGSIVHNFVVSLILVSIGFFLNSANIPIYFFNISTGNLRNNTVSSLAATVFNLVFGIILGLLFGSYGVIAAWDASLAVNTVLLLISFKREFDTAHIGMGNKDVKLLSAMVLVNLLVLFYSYTEINLHMIGTILACACLYITVLYLLLRKDERIRFLLSKIHIPGKISAN
jgi:O-antigen/teichoic acid export membrane protein